MDFTAISIEQTARGQFTVMLDGKPLHGVRKVELICEAGKPSVATITMLVEPRAEVSNS